MSAGAKGKDKIIKIKAHLTSLNEQPLSRASLVIILFLEIVILVSIFRGNGLMSDVFHANRRLRGSLR